MRRLVLQPRKRLSLSLLITTQIILLGQRVKEKAFGPIGFGFSAQSLSLVRCIILSFIFFSTATSANPKVAIIINLGSAERIRPPSSNLGDTIGSLIHKGETLAKQTYEALGYDTVIFSPNLDPENHPNRAPSIEDLQKYISSLKNVAQLKIDILGHGILKKSEFQIHSNQFPEELLSLQNLQQDEGSKYSCNVNYTYAACGTAFQKKASDTKENYITSITFQNLIEVFHKNNPGVPIVIHSFTCFSGCLGLNLAKDPLVQVYSASGPTRVASAFSNKTKSQKILSFFDHFYDKLSKIGKIKGKSVTSFFDINQEAAQAQVEFLTQSSTPIAALVSSRSYSPGEHLILNWCLEHPNGESIPKNGERSSAELNAQIKNMNSRLALNKAVQKKLGCSHVELNLKEHKDEANDLLFELTEIVVKKLFEKWRGNRIEELRSIQQRESKLLQDSCHYETSLQSEHRLIHEITETIGNLTRLSDPENPDPENYGKILSYQDSKRNFFLNVLVHRSKWTVGLIGTFLSRLIMDYTSLFDFDAHQSETNILSSCGLPNPDAETFQQVISEKFGNFRDCLKKMSSKDPMGTLIVAKTLSDHLAKPTPCASLVGQQKLEEFELSCWKSFAGRADATTFSQFENIRHLEKTLVP